MKWRFIIAAVLVVAIFPTQSFVFCKGITDAVMETARSGMNADG